ncbi:MAG TPA: hypothetical protein VMR98_01245 [Candidatus Polarisedimenticolaceae bacterium]|nr:hypothetical protein [Candidatus Polarisedimenticolaceae bacterium]
MLRRLSLQLGVLVLVGAFATTANAYADALSTDTSVQPGATLGQQQTGKSELTTTTSGIVEAKISTHSFQSTGDGGKPPVKPDDGSTQDGGPTATTTENSSTPASTSDVTPGHPGATATDPSPAAGQGGSSPASALSSSGAAAATPAAGSLAAATYNKVSFAMQRAVHRQIARQQAALQAPAVPVTPPPTAPSAPQNPGDFLVKLSALLTSSIVPELQGMSGYADGLPSALAALNLQLAFTALLAIGFSLLLLDFYTARLRRSGFLGAARSDVGAAILTFVTPPKMGFIGSYTT